MGRPSQTETAQAAHRETQISSIDSVVQDLCGKSVAMLGEPPIHGFGKTLDFKVELVRRLVDQCHYNALFIESGIYDYINIEQKLKSGQGVADPMISAAIGGLWANQEVQALVPFLRKRVEEGTLTLGGLDDQLGAGTYAQHDMPSHLVQYLQGDERSQCLSVLKRHTLWQYTAANPYQVSDKADILRCLDKIEVRIPPPVRSASASADADRAMIESLKRNFARDFPENISAKDDQAVMWRNNSNRSMYLNFRWLRSRLPSHSKIIVWAATVHLAKNLGGVSAWDGSVPLGAYLRRDFGDRAFSLGFSAYSGNYAFARQPARQLSMAPETSLEATVLASHSSDTVYLMRPQLQDLGPIAARPLGIDFTTAHWDDVVDGLVVFREERAPKPLGKSN